MITHKIDKLCDLYFVLLKSNKHIKTKEVLLGWLRLKTYLYQRKNRGNENIKIKMDDIRKKFIEYEPDIECEYCNYSVYKKIIKLQNELFLVDLDKIQDSNPH